MPLVVYLDTQDYIKLFNERVDGTNHQHLQKLLSYRDRGEIVIGFSFANVFEFITRPDVANRNERVRRGQLIKDICGQNAFPYPTDIPKGASFPNEGMWMFPAGEKLITARKFRSDMHQALLNELAREDGLNRQQRRVLGRKTSMPELFNRLGSTWGRKRSDYGSVPVSDEIIRSRIFERFMKGECSDLEFESRMNAWFSDPAEYSRIVYDYADSPNVITEYFQESIDEIERLVELVQNAINQIRMLNAERSKSRSDLINAGIRSSDARQLTKQFPIPEPKPDSFGIKLEPLLGDGRAGHFGHYISWISKSDQRFKRSDVMDLFQMCYAYDCDLFRCDKNMAHIFRDFEPFKGKLVSQFKDLPKRIETVISSQTS